MNVCLQAVFNKTIYFKAIADELTAAGHEVFWTTTSPKWRNWLTKRGVPGDRILLLRRDESRTVDPHAEENQRLVKALEESSGLSFKKIFFMDRVVSRRPWDEGKEYFVYVARRLNDFIVKSNIEVVLGEATWSDEVISALVCQTNGVSFYNVNTLRIPSDRFMFFKGYTMADYEEVAPSCETDNYLEMADRLRERVVAGLKPNYWYWNSVVPKIDLSFVSKIRRKVREAIVETGQDATVKSLGHHLFHERQYLKPFRYAGLRMTGFFEQPHVDEPYVLYALHKQPEASIDVMGADRANQFELIKSITRVLPFETRLYVKEHANCLGDRPWSYLRAIKRLPGVRLIEPSVDIHDLIKGASLVLTVTGTVAFEAAFHGRIAGTFSRMYFNKLSGVRHLTSVNDIPELLTTGLRSGGLSPADRRVMAHMLANSFEGVIGDPISAPMCMTGENIRHVASGFLKLLSVLKTRAYEKVS
jgi:hypothetical protein